MDEVVREPDRKEADRNQDDTEERVHRAHVLALLPRLERVAQHEVRGVEEEQDEEEHELVRAPRPPDAPRRLRPQRARDEREHAEDHALVDRGVALEVGARVALPQHAQRLPRAPAEADVRRQRDRHVDVEDLLRDPLVGVLGRDEEREHQRDHRQAQRGCGERGEPAIR